MRALHAHQVVHPSSSHSLAKLPAVTVASIREQDVVAYSPRERVVQLRQGKLPLALEAHLLGHTRGTAPLTAAGLLLGQVQLHADTAAALLPSQVQADCHLAVIGAPQGARVLASHAH